jgi:hypothetical protein
MARDVHPASNSLDALCANTPSTTRIASSTGIAHAQLLAEVYPRPAARKAWSWISTNRSTGRQFVAGSRPVLRVIRMTDERRHLVTGSR